MAMFFWLLEIPIQVPLLLVVFGVNPDLDAVFYVTALVFHLFEAALVLAQLVYAQVGRNRRDGVPIVSPPLPGNRHW
jgi:hypothetical protein